MAYKLRVWSKLLLFFSSITWGSSISTLGDIFTIVGPLKYGDMAIFIVLFTALCSSKFRSAFVFCIRQYSGFVVLLAALVLLTAASIFASYLDGVTYINDHLFVVLRLIYYAILTMSIATFVLYFDCERIILNGLLIGIAAVSLTTIFYAITTEGLMIGSYYKISTEFGANPLATYISILLPISLCYAAYEKVGYIRNMHRVVVGVLLVTVMMTFAKGAWLTIIIACAIYFVLRMYRFGNMNIKVVLAVFVLLAIILIIFGKDIVSMGALEINASKGNTSERIEKYKEAFEIFSDNPVIGIGAQNFPVNDPHTSYGQMLAEVGILGALCLMGIFLYSLLCSKRLLTLSRKVNLIRECEPTILFLCVISLLVEALFTGLVLSMHLFWLITGMVFGLYARNRLYLKHNQCGVLVPSIVTK